MKLEYGQVLFLAFRYALGRETYIVADVVDTLIAHWEFIQEKERQMIYKEIKQAVESNRAGAQTEIFEWEKILGL